MPITRLSLWRISLSFTPLKTLNMPITRLSSKSLPSRSQIPSSGLSSREAASEPKIRAYARKKRVKLSAEAVVEDDKGKIVCRKVRFCYMWTQIHHDLVYLTFQ